MKSEVQYLGICQYPSTVIFVDDNVSFLKNVELGIDAKTPIKLFDRPKEALDFLNKSNKIKPFTERYIKSEDDDEFDRFTLDVSIHDIHHQVYYKERFKEVSVVVVDYVMPQLNGLEFFKALNKKNIKKILLTGEADAELAVDAFNKNLIDRFISKGTGNLIEQINKAVKEMQQSYFIDLSKNILEVSKIAKRHLDCMHDKYFYAYFLDVCQSNKIVEYYLFDEAGSFILLDSKGTPYILAVKNKKALQEICEFATEYSDPSLFVADALKSGSHIPFFYSDSDYNTPPEKWDGYMHMAEKVKGEVDTYYCALIKDVSQYAINKNRIFGYQAFIEDQMQ